MPRILVAHIYTLNYTCFYSHTHVSVLRLATSWAVRGSSRWGEIFGTRPDRPRIRSRFLYNGFLVSFPGVKHLESGVAVYFHLAPRLKKGWGIPLLHSVPSSAYYIESRVRLQAGECGIFGGQCGAETGSSQNTSVLLVRIIPAMLLTQPDTTRIIRTSGRNLRNLETALLFRKSGSIG